MMTFDDGLANFYTNALPLLIADSVPAVIFVTTQHVQNPDNWIDPYPGLAEEYLDRNDPGYDQSASELFNGLSVEQISEISRNSLITIGSHTVTHPLLTKITDTELEYELTASKEFLENIAGTEINLVAYPAGDYDERVIDAARRAGYRAAFAENSRKLGSPSYEIPRVGIYSSAPHYMTAKLSGLHMRPLRSPIFLSL
jgi:peptidoglycan/xylan/chitin deacetylase (PgdA/CDA1 family)